MINTIVFDLDGTLLNTIDDIADSLNQALQAFDYPVFSIQEVLQMVGYGMRHLVEVSVPKHVLADTKQMEVFTETYLAFYRQNQSSKTKPYPGVLEMLSALSAVGLRLAVLSNKPDQETRELVKHYFGDVFDQIYGQREGIPVKPDPAAVWGMLDELGTVPACSVFVGDSDVDVATGKSAGMYTVGVTWGFRNREDLLSADSLADTAAELSAQLLELV